MRVVVAVAEPAAVHHHRVVEQRARPVRRGPEALEQVGEQAHVVGVDSRELVELLGVVAVVRQPVMGVGHPEVRIGAPAQLAAEHEGEDAGDVGLPREGDQVVHQPDVVLEVVGNADGAGQGRQLRVGALRLRQGDAALEGADGVEVLIEPGPVALPDGALEVREVVGDRVEDAAVAPHLGDALLGRAPVAEEPLEHHPRVVLHRQRRRRRAPRDGVQVDAAVAVLAVADEPVEVDGELERRQRRVAADVLRRELVGGDPGPHVRALGLLRVHAVQPCRARPRVLAVPVAEGLGLAVGEAAHHRELLAVRRQRLQDGRQLEPGAGLGRRPLLHHRPVGDVDEPEPADRPRRGPGLRGEGRHHGVEQGQGDGRAEAAQEGAAGQRQLSDHHDRVLLIWNGGLLTTPRMSDEKRWPSAAASRVMARMAGASWCSTPRPSA